jgi:predicted TIM-barrel fold metal-dependent hydrolase
MESRTWQMDLPGSFDRKLGSAESSPDAQDKFVAMVTAKATVDLKLTDYEPRPTLVTPVHAVERSRVPAIDYHNHLDSLNPLDVLKIMDACGIERIVNITMKVGEEALRVMDRFHTAAPGRFATIAWMDWTGLDQPQFFSGAVDRLEQLAAHGACGIKFWKDLGLTLRDTSGDLLRIDDERLAPIFARAGELGIPVMFHTADPDAFFLPTDRYNERYEELAAHPEWSFHGSTYSKPELLEQRNRVFAQHPKTTFVAAHVGESAEHLDRVASVLGSYPNVMIDMSARVAELGRQPYRARDFFLRFADRILFGTDLLPDVDMYRLHFRFLETADEYFEYPSHASRQGRWNIYGISLPDDVLTKIYRTNALRLLL